MVNNEFIFWGSSGQARVLFDLISFFGYKLIALFDNNQDRISPWPEVPIFYGLKGFHMWLEKNTERKLPNAAVAIGGSNGHDRCKIFNMLNTEGFHLPPLIHPSAVISKNATIEDGCQILAGSILCTNVCLGHCVIINTAASVDHESVLNEGVHIAPGARLCGCTEVGPYSHIGPGAVVVPHVKIGSNTIIGAGSVVTRNIPDNVIAWGSPVRIIRENIV